MKRIISILFIILLLENFGLYAQSNGDYRSVFSGNWNDPTIWQIYYIDGWTATNEYPTYSNNSQITIQTGHEVILNVSTTLDQLIIENNAVLSIPQNIELNLNNGTGDDIVLNGTMNWTGSLTICGNSSLLINNTGILNILGDTGKSVRYGTGYFNNYGTINWIGNGSFYGGSKIFNNYSSGMIDFKSDAGIYNDYGGDGVYRINNSGTIRKSAGVNITDLNYVQIYNTGNIEIESGAVKVSNYGESNGIITINSGKCFQVNANTFNLLDDALINGSGEFLVSGGSLKAGGTNTGADFGADVSLNFTGGSIDNSGKINIYGTMNWFAGTITLSTLNIKTGATFNIEGDTNKSLRYGAGSINNNGTIIWTGSGNIYGGSKVINNYSEGVFEIHNDAGFYTDSGGDGKFCFNNYGLLKKTSSYLTSDFNFIELNNYGSVQVESGILKLNNGGSYTGSITVNTDAVLNFSGGNHSIMDDATFNGDGIYLLSNGSLNGIGTLSGGTFNQNSTLNMTGGNISNSGKININGTMNWSAGTISIVNLTIGSTGNLNIIGDSQKIYRYGAGSLNNYGVINWSGNGNIVGGSKTFNNMESGIFNIQNDSSINSDFGGDGLYTFNNYGLLKKSEGSGYSFFNYVRLNNSGTLQVLSGAFSIVSSGQLNNFSSNMLSQGTFDIHTTFKFNNANIVTNNANIILNGSESQILDQNDNNALLSLSTISSAGTLELKNGRNFVSNASNINVNGVLNCGNNIFSNNGNFYLNDNASLIIGHSNGISLNELTGNIQSSGSRVFSQNASYKYNGSVSQICGNGLPAQVKDFELSNAAGLTLSSNLIIKSQFNLLDGIIHTNQFKIILGIAESEKGVLNKGNGWINGIFGRWINNEETNPILFPIGNMQYYRPLTIVFTEPVTHSGIVISDFVSSNPGLEGLPLDDNSWMINNIAPEGYWLTQTDEGLTGGIYNLFLTAKGFNGLGNVETLRILKRNSIDEDWTLSGIHENGSGSASEPVVKRNDLTSFSHFAIGSGNDSTLPVTLSSFNTICSSIEYVNIQWITQSESNLLGYHIYRNDTNLLNNAQRITNSLVQAKNQSNENTYTFKDSEIEKNQEYYYWLQSIENNGSFEFFGPSRIITLDDPDIPEYPIYSELLNVYPNPVSHLSSVIIKVKIKEDESASLSIYNIKGQLIKSFLSINPGIHQITWDGRDNNKKHCSSGIYFYKLVSPTYSMTKKMLVIE